MKAMCYISDNKKKNVFDKLADEQDISISHYNTGQIKSLVAFVAREKTIPAQNFIVMDLTDTDFSNEHIISAIQTLKCISSARPIFIAPQNSKTEELYGRLVNFRVTNLISFTSSTDIISEMRLCLSDEGMVFTDKTAQLQNASAMAANAVVQPLIIPEGTEITLCVSGCMSRIGTTTQAFALWHYLKSLGFSPAILSREEKFIKLLMELYENEVITYEGHISVKNIPFCFQPDKDLWNAYIIDSGVLSEDKCQDFMEADISVLVGGTKPWELNEFATSLRLADGVKNMVSLMSFTTPKEVDDLHKVLNIPMYSVPYHPDIWDKGVSASAYKTSILPHITKLCRC